MRLRHSIAVVFLLAMTCAAAAFAGEKPATPAGRDGWPATRAGEMGRGWVNAYCAGEDSMRGFLSRNMAPKNLEEKNVAVRVQKYKDLHDQYGRLQLDAVEESTPEKVTVKLLDADAKSRAFIFTVQDGPPYKLVSVMIRQPMDGIHGLFNGFHH
jgi:hypothetical protein